MTATSCMPYVGRLGLRDPRPTAMPVEDGSTYRSDTNDLWLGSDELRDMVARFA